MDTISFSAATSLFSLRIKQLESEVYLLHRTNKRAGASVTKNQIQDLKDKKARLEQTRSLKRDFIKAFKKAPEQQ